MKFSAVKESFFTERREVFGIGDEAESRAFGKGALGDRSYFFPFKGRHVFTECERKSSYRRQCRSGEGSKTVAPVEGVFSHRFQTAGVQDGTHVRLIEGVFFHVGKRRGQFRQDEVAATVESVFFYRDKRIRESDVS